MRRSYWLILATGAVFIAAVGLRVRSHLVASGQPPAVTSRPAGRALRISEPRDYVANPWVDPSERDKGPNRLISLAPSITEIVCALGLRDRLVGRTPYCTHPPGIERVADVGSLVTVNLDMIKTLKPDLILVTRNSGQVIDALGKLGLPHAALPHDTLEEVYTAIERIGSLCGRPKTATALAAFIRNDLETLRQTARRLDLPRRRVLIILGDLPVPPRPVWVAGPGSFLESLLQAAGQQNAAAGAMPVSHGEIGLERLLTLDVEAILTFGEPLTDRQWDDLYRTWAKVGGIPAIRERRVARVGGSEWLSAGPRVAIALHHFITALAEGEGTN
ncbi:MAG TPA: helical backbone metal receptor [Phycisphaerae bacterium]|nr:helical backbone metal receptor [Phycisphaerae bacterium]HRR86091.1 helical backbone metal receptor [Phycisphaerae bacterium]